jgi:predicted phosphoadenosine phosphosulfate sulfurtransferase
MKKYIEKSVLEASIERISISFDIFENIYISFSGGKDSTVMLHLVMNEAIKRNRKVGLFIVDLEAQYADTIKHIQNCVKLYEKHLDIHWFCPELLLRNSVSNFEPKWVCWDKERENEWVRNKPAISCDLDKYPFYMPKMEFEEFIILFGEWYANQKSTCAFVGIRADESLHRYRAIVSNKIGLTKNNYKWTTKISKYLYNVYPIYDWKTQDIWVFLGKNSNLPSNQIYNKMSMAGVPISEQRLCQPYGDDQKKGLWLYHILEPDTWFKLINRVSGVNSGALYIQESGNITGYRFIEKPDNITWKDYTNLLLSTLPTKTRNNYIDKFKKFIVGWKKRGYEIIPDEAPKQLENKQWVPSWRRMARCILRNDYYCKGLGQTQPLSEAYVKFKQIQKLRRQHNVQNNVTIVNNLF